MPDPHQENSKATVGVEEEARKAAFRWLEEEAGKVQPWPGRITGIIRAVTPVIEQAIHNEEREKVLGHLTSDEVIEAVARIPWDNEQPGAWDDKDAWEFEDGVDPREQEKRDLKSAFEAALASLPLDAMEEPQGKREQLPCHVMNTPAARAAGDDPRTASQDTGLEIYWRVSRAGRIDQWDLATPFEEAAVIGIAERLRNHFSDEAAELPGPVSWRECMTEARDIARQARGKLGKEVEQDGVVVEAAMEVQPDGDDLVQPPDSLDRGEAAADDA